MFWYRSELDSLVNTHEYFTVTQENTKPGENLTMAHQDKVSRTVFHDIHARLPKVILQVVNKLYNIFKQVMDFLNVELLSNFMLLSYLVSPT